MTSSIGFILIVILYISHVKSYIRLGKYDLVGVYPPVFAPFYDDYKINYNVIPRYAKFLAENGIPGIVVAGTNGEGPVLSLEERMLLSEAWTAAGKQYNLKVILQVSGLPFPDALKLAKYAGQKNVYAMLALPELLYRPENVEQLVNYIKMLADQAPEIPIYYYDIPGATNVYLNMVDFFKNATCLIPSFSGLKTGFSNALQVMGATELRSYQRIFVRTDAELQSSFQMKLNGTISASCNVFPKLCTEIVSAARSERFSKARDLQLTLNRQIAAITFIDEAESIAVGRFKAAMEIVNGIPVGELRKPQNPVSFKTRLEITKNLLDLNVKIAKNIFVH